MLFNKQRYEFFSKSQRLSRRGLFARWCCSISKDTNFSANHNTMRTAIRRIGVLFNKQRYEFFSKSQQYSGWSLLVVRCCSISKDTNFSANHNPLDFYTSILPVLFNKQRYEFFSKSQRFIDMSFMFWRCCSISKDTNFSANHNSTDQEGLAREVLFNKQRYEFFSKSQRAQWRRCKRTRCCSISKDTNFSANHNGNFPRRTTALGVVQ